MYVKHLGADVKLHRARQMVGQLVVLQQEYLASDALRLEASRTPDGATAQRIRIDRPPPAEIAELAGDAIHTARHALDDLAVSLVIASRRTPRNTRFPIAHSAHDYVVEEDRCLRRANQKARDAVRSVAPWKGGDEKLWELHQLDAASESPAIHLGQALVRAPVRVPSTLQVLSSSTSPGNSPDHRLEDGSLIVLDTDVAHTDTPTPFGAEVRLVIGAGEIVRGHPVARASTCFSLMRPTSSTGLSLPQSAAEPRFTWTLGAPPTGVRWWRR